MDYIPTWKSMDSAPKDGTPILISIKNLGIHRLTWEVDDYDYGYWCVDDNKHGPYAMRGYNEEDLLAWTDLPKFETNEYPRIPLFKVGDKVRVFTWDWLMGTKYYLCKVIMVGQYDNDLSDGIPIDPKNRPVIYAYNVQRLSDGAIGCGIVEFLLTPASKKRVKK